MLKKKIVFLYMQPIAVSVGLHVNYWPATLSGQSLLKLDDEKIAAQLDELEKKRMKESNVTVKAKDQCLQEGALQHAEGHALDFRGG